LLKDFEKQFYRIVKFCGWETTEQEVLKIKKETDLLNMKKKEAQGMFLAHVDSGQTSKWVTTYSSEELNLFLKNAKTTLYRYGYLNEQD
jgi:hypothetical protein